METKSSKDTLNPENLRQAIDEHFSQRTSEEVVERAEELTPRRFPIHVLDACHSAKVQFDQPIQRRIGHILAQRLAHVGRETTPTTIPRLPDGIGAVLAQLGAPDLGIYVFVTDASMSTDQKKMLAHELQHLIDRLLDKELPPLDALVARQHVEKSVL